MRLVSSAVVALALAGCGGGGGGGPAATNSVNPLLYFSSAFTTGFGFSGPNTGTATVTTTGTTVNRIEITTTANPASNVVFDTAAGDTITLQNNQLAASKADGSAAGLFGAGFSYQSFGGWITGLPAGSAVAVGSTGEVTPATTVTGRTGTARYGGPAFGTASITAGGSLPNGQFATVASTVVNIDFDADTVNIQITGTRRVPLTQLATASDSDFLSIKELDLSGSASLNGAAYQGSTAGLTSGSLSGVFSGQIYGPDAEETGGVARLNGVASGSSVNYATSFGAAR